MTNVKIMLDIAVMDYFSTFLSYLNLVGRLQTILDVFCLSFRIVFKLLQEVFLQIIVVDDSRRGGAYSTNIHQIVITSLKCFSKKYQLVFKDDSGGHPTCRDD